MTQVKKSILAAGKALAATIGSGAGNTPDIRYYYRAILKAAVGQVTGPEQTNFGRLQRAVDQFFDTVGSRITPGEPPTLHDLDAIFTASLPSVLTGVMGDYLTDTRMHALRRQIEAMLVAVRSLDDEPRAIIQLYTILTETGHTHTSDYCELKQAFPSAFRQLLAVMAVHNVTAQRPVEQKEDHRLATKLLGQLEENASREGIVRYEATLRSALHDKKDQSNYLLAYYGLVLKAAVARQLTGPGRDIQAVEKMLDQKLLEIAPAISTTGKVISFGELNFVVHHQAVLLARSLTSGDPLKEAPLRHRLVAFASLLEAVERLPAYESAVIRLFILVVEAGLKAHPYYPQAARDFLPAIRSLMYLVGDSNGEALELLEQVLERIQSRLRTMPAVADN